MEPRAEGGPRLCVVGTSNSVSAGGYGRVLFQDPGFASSRNASLGMCCSDLFAFQRANIDPARLDLCVLEFACNDGTLLSSRGLTRERIEAAVTDAVSSLSAAGCLPVIVILPLDRTRFDGSVIRGIYRELADGFALPFFDGYAFLERLVGEGEPGFPLFKDPMHLENPVSVALGRVLSPLLRRALAASRPGPLFYEEGVRQRFVELAEAAAGPVRTIRRTTSLIEAEVVVMEGEGSLDMRLEDGWDIVSVVAEFTLCRGVLGVSGTGSTRIFLSLKDGRTREGKATLAIWPLKKGVRPRDGIVRLDLSRDGPFDMNASNKSSPLGPEEVPTLALSGFVARREGQSLPFRHFLPEALDLVSLVPEEEFAAHRAALSGGRQGA